MKKTSPNAVAVLGLGSENYALLEYSFAQGMHMPVTVFDKRSRSELKKQYPALASWKHVSWQTAAPTYEMLRNYSLIFRAPGFFLKSDIRRRLQAKGVVVTSAMQLFMDIYPSKNIIGVTGTKGKGTTSSLIAAILKAGGKRVWLGGNIGVAPFSFFSKIKKNDWIVLELSSFQLQEIKTSPRIAVFTNFSPEHLAPADPQNPNYHLSLTEYWEAKNNLLRFQKKQDIAIINQKLKSKKLKIIGRAVYFTASSLATALAGEHNKENIAAAQLAARAAGIKTDIIAKTVKKFKGLHYRLEKVAERNGVAYYNDSFATTPESAITALNSFSQPIILLAGGADKGANFSKLAKLIKQKAKAVILFKGVATPRLRTELKKSGYDKEVIEASTMSAAVSSAKKIARSGDIVLLSPACASFGIFKNYKDRGEQFNQAVLRR